MSTQFPGAIPINVYEVIINVEGLHVFDEYEAIANEYEDDGRGAQTNL